MNKNKTFPSCSGQEEMQMFQVTSGKIFTQTHRCQSLATQLQNAAVKSYIMCHPPFILHLTTAEQTFTTQPLLSTTST